MKSSTLLACTALAAATPALAHPLTSSSTSRRDTGQSNDLGLASGCMRSYNNIPFGWLPDYNMPEPRIGTLNADTGKKACMYGEYSQITSTSYDDSQLTNSGVMNDLKNSGAVFVPAIMPTGVKFNQIDSNLANQIGNTVRKFTSQGITVWLRFAHEMNYYAGEDSTYPGGTGAEFIQAWQNVHAVCASIEGCLMFWCPNRDSLDKIAPYWPGENYVDIIGIDWYANDDETFAGSLSDFYNAYPGKYNKHFILGETGTASDASVSAKENWLKQVTMSDFSAFPNYQGAHWFEYLKGGYDFRVIYGQSGSTVTETLSYFR